MCGGLTIMEQIKYSVEICNAIALCHIIDKFENFEKELFEGLDIDAIKPNSICSKVLLCNKIRNVSFVPNVGLTKNKMYNYRTAGLTVSYRFGSLNAQVKKTAKSIENDDLIGRKKE